MGKINVLSSKIYNRIAAGEVIERPASVVKELVENSIDAGATSITVEIENGGLSSITIIDNGVGIEKNDLQLAVLPHATSKISKISDLDSIETLGFRGEALASIASVSKLTITSLPKGQDTASSIYVEGGIINDPTDTASALGTQIQVKNLFYNTPVRAKFLKSERSEENEIALTVSRFILSKPEISFRFIVDGQTILQSFGDGLESAFICVYGAKTVGECYFIDTEKNGIKIKGYIGKHHFTKSNRTHQTTFLNGRYVVNQTISSAVANAYAPYLMKRQYPFYVLDVTIPTDAVDVNVHPNKTDVRFINNQIIYGTIYSVISKIFDGSSEIISIISTENKEEIKQIEKIEKPIINKEENKDNYVKHNQDNFTFSSLFVKDSKVDLVPKTTNTVNDDIFKENKLYLEKLEREKAEQQQSMKIETELYLVGQALNTFLIFEDGENLYLIDQHAAHERILFDKFNESVLKADVIKQPLLIPYVFTVNSTEFDFLIERIGALQSMGIDIEEFGLNTFKVSEIPVILSNMSIEKFFNDVLKDVNTLKSLTITSLLMEKLASKACRSAIKSGDKMSDDEIKVLLKLMKGNLGLKCPHGRPIAVKITRTEIDKWFKRIV